MDVTLKIDKLNAPGFPFNGVDTRFLLKEGLLKVEPMRLSLADGVVNGKLTLDGRMVTPHVTTVLDVQKLILASFF